MFNRRPASDIRRIVSSTSFDSLPKSVSGSNLAVAMKDVSLHVLRVYKDQRCFCYQCTFKVSRTCDKTNYVKHFSFDIMDILCILGAIWKLRATG